MCVVCTVCTVCTTLAHYNILYVLYIMYVLCICTYMLRYRIDTQEVLDPRPEAYMGQSFFDLSTFRGLLEQDVRYSVRMLAENDIGRGNYSDPEEFAREFDY